MDWIFLVIVLVAAYALAAYYIHRNRLWPEYITFYGPLMAVKTEKVGFFDRSIRFSTFLRVYGTAGVAMVIVVSAFMTVMLFFSIQHIVVQRPPLTAVNDLKNVLAIPGVNDFIPFTVAVWLGLLVTMVVHEFGHAVLCRVEGIRVKSMGVLMAVIPIGAFVEPDEEDQERTRGMKKMRMFGAGITNNLVLGLVCFALVVFLLGFAVPTPAPFIGSVYQDYPADRAGVVPFSVIREVNGIPVADVAGISTIMNTTKPGDNLTVLVEKRGVVSSHTLTLASWPDRTSGFMGVTYYNAPAIKEQFGIFSSPIGLVVFMAVPIYTITDSSSWSQFSLLTIDSAESVVWQVPFPQYWTVIQLLFWCGWFNLVVGTFNALPLIPLDGGYIMKEGVERILDRKGLVRYSAVVTNAVTTVMLAVLVAIVFLPLALNG